MILISSSMSWAKNVHRISHCGSADSQQHSPLCLSPQTLFSISEVLAKHKRWKQLSLICHEHIRQTLEELQRQVWSWASSLVSCFDELIQNPDLSHTGNVDPGLNWTLPVMCKFTSVSAINKSLFEWSWTVFLWSLLHWYLLKKNFFTLKATFLFNIFALLCSREKPFCGKLRTFQHENLANSFCSKKKKKKFYSILS